MSAPVTERRLRKADLVAWEAWSAADRAWFAANPGWGYRLRRIAEAERVILRAAPASHVLVRQVHPGFRLRRPVVIAGDLPDEDPICERLDRGETVHVGPGGVA
jgi:hypothetical protein